MRDEQILICAGRERKSNRNAQVVVRVYITSKSTIWFARNSVAPPRAAQTNAQTKPVLAQTNAQIKPVLAQTNAQIKPAWRKSNAV
jgi:hypothetical protein